METRSETGLKVFSPRGEARVGTGTITGQPRAALEGSSTGAVGTPPRLAPALPLRIPLEGQCPSDDFLRRPSGHCFLCSSALRSCLHPWPPGAVLELRQRDSRVRTSLAGNVWEASCHLSCWVGESSPFGSGGLRSLRRPWETPRSRRPVWPGG